MSRTIKKKSVVAILGCNECTYFSQRKNCIKVGFSTNDINEGKLVTTVDKGTFKLSDISSCPMKLTQEEKRLLFIRTASIKKARKAVLTLIT